LIVLDTHVWIWWASGASELSAGARSEIARATERSEVHISAISSWEVALLVRKGRLELSMPVSDWVARSEALPFVRFVPLDNRLACLSNQLAGEFHDDPADRIIAATALTLGAVLVTKDARLRNYDSLRTLW
jgi:PIN domain nuclease of toxin-antitoxin system